MEKITYPGLWDVSCAGHVSAGESATTSALRELEEELGVVAQVEELQRHRAVEEDTARHLRLEIDTLRSPKRIEAIATERLHLVVPTQEEAIVIERVVPGPPPAKSVVARR